MSNSSIAMTTPMFVALPASPNDLSSIASLQYQACASDRGFCAIFPVPPTGAAVTHLTKQYEEMMENDSTAHVMIVKETVRGEIVAYAIWNLVPSKTVQVVEEEMLADIDPGVFPAGADIELGQQLIKNSNRKRNEIVSECFGAGKPYLYLGAIGTKPSYQNQGAASKLMACIVDQADDRNLPAFIEGTPMALPLYRKFGFQEYDHLVIDLGPPTKLGDVINTCMIRFPNTA